MEAISSALSLTDEVHQKLSTTSSPMQSSKLLPTSCAEWPLSVSVYVLAFREIMFSCASYVCDEN